MTPKFFLLDVDGVMTTGHFIYSNKGKQYKIFGPDDHDALKLLKKFIKIEFVSSDLKGFSISKKRIKDDMGFPIHYISTKNRINWAKKKFPLNKTIFMGDGIFDYLLMKEVFFSICPKNSSSICFKYADYITKKSGGDRAVAEACLFILKKFFKINV
jgi:3-deoxy-D-manno-octulosonate 8-phosphate phosphatase (KDO 8-P phosphatase)|tara:strand:+ start:331 stop:801 length:471 start_codon:yes stop_codon:yes gene_type:complete